MGVKTTLPDAANNIRGKNYPKCKCNKNMLVSQHAVNCLRIAHRWDEDIKTTDLPIRIDQFTCKTCGDRQLIRIVKNDPIFLAREAANKTPRVFYGARKAGQMIGFSSSALKASQSTGLLREGAHQIKAPRYFMRGVGILYDKRVLDEFLKEYKQAPKSIWRQGGPRKGKKKKVEKIKDTQLKGMEL